VKESSERRPVTASGQVLKELEDWLHNLPGTQVDIVRLAGLVGPGRHPGRFFAGKSAPDGQHGVNLVHLEDVIGAIELLLQAPKGGHIYNICAPSHPARSTFYPLMARQLGLAPPVLVRQRMKVKAKLLMAIAFVMSWGLSISIPIRW
jgi:nucleoside-diphosphate-sugar epimerase